MIVDSVFWIAVKYTKDKHHKLALALIPDILKSKKLYVTDYIINEVHAFLLRKANSKIALEALDILTTTGKIEVIYNSEVSFKGSLDITKKYPKLSIVDANILYFSSLLKIPFLTFEEYMGDIVIK